MLREHFPSIVDVGFTADMEKQLDAIEEGSSRWVQVIEEFWKPFSKQLEEAEQQIQRVKLQDELAGVDCDKCGRPMVIKRSRYGKFIACSGYPDCKNTKPLWKEQVPYAPDVKATLWSAGPERGGCFSVA